MKRREHSNPQGRAKRAKRREGSKHRFAAFFSSEGRRTLYCLLCCFAIPPTFRFWFARCHSSAALEDLVMAAAWLRTERIESASDLRLRWTDDDEEETGASATGGVTGASPAAATTAGGDSTTGTTAAGAAATEARPTRPAKLGARGLPVGVATGIAAGEGSNLVSERDRGQGDARDNNSLLNKLVFWPIGGTSDEGESSWMIEGPQTHRRAFSAGEVSRAAATAAAFALSPAAVD